MVKLDIHTLAHHLKQERLYVSSEKQLIQRLNADVLKTAEKLYRTAWIAKQQRINLDRLIITSAEASPAECCQHAKILEDTQFVDGYKQLGFQETAYGEFLSRLRENPRLIASSLVAGEKLNQENTQSVIYTVFTSLYGNCIMQEKQEKDKDDLGPDRFSTLTDEPSPRLSAQAQVAEDILDKYRNAIKRTSPSEGAMANDESAEVMGDGESAHDSPREEALQNISADDLPDSASQAAHPQDSAFSYRDVKKKLRLALCSADSVAFPVLTHSTRNGLPDHTDPEDNEIVCFLKVQIAEAINLQDKSLMAQLQETMRCVCRFDNRTCRKLLASIAEDYRSRSNMLMDLHMDHEGSPQETIQEVQPEEVLVISLGTGPQLTPGMMSENEVLNMQLSDGGQGDVPVDENKLHGPSNRSNSVSSLDLEGESVSELGAGPSGSNGVEALQLLEHEQEKPEISIQSR